MSNVWWARSCALLRSLAPPPHTPCHAPQDAAAWAPFQVQLELHGLPAGTLEGHMRIEVSR